MTVLVQLSAGTTIGHYVIVAPIGRGGMGEVFLARDSTLGRLVALKVLSRDFVGHDEQLQRFQREARHLAALSHPNIVTVFSVEEIDGLHLLSMEYVDGRTLRHLIAPGGLSLERFLEIACALADAVAAAHERGVMHRDLKPENVMVTESGWVKVLDFGLAKAQRDSGLELSGASETVTRAGVVLGTLPYMSPEQIDGTIVDARSDIFSLGIMLHEMLTGERPFKGETAARTLTSILRDTPTPVGVVRRDAPPALEGLVRRCLEKDPALRFQSAGLVRDALQDLLHAARLERPRTGAWRRATSGGFSLRSAGTSLVSLDTRIGLTVLLGAILAINWAETSIEAALRRHYGVGESLGYELAAVMSSFEQGLSFERHDLTHPLGIYAVSVAYFFVPIVLGLVTAWRLARLPTVKPYRTFVFAIALTYGIGLVCYIFFPVPERWAYPDSDAVLLSDLWTTALIDALRPISGLDNCFPSFHVASMTIVSVLGYVYRLRFRHAVMFLAGTVILSTFMLGIHWLPDIAAGFALGLITTRLALRSNLPMPAGHLDDLTVEAVK